MRKKSVALAIRDPDRPHAVLTVRRPDHDPELPGIWGLPATTLRTGESWEDALPRTGYQKLGVTLAPVRELRRGTAPRKGYTLEMRLYEARILEGEPRVPQPHPGITQYSALRWTDGRNLHAGAAAGSLCCQLFLQSENDAASTPGPPPPPAS